MEFTKFNNKFFCGVDLHAKSIFVCLMDYSGKVFIHNKFTSDPNVFLSIIKPYGSDLVVGVESTFNWYWLADICHSNNINFALGHALYMKAIHGGKKKNDKIDSKTIAELLRSGMFPLAYSYPKEKRDTRDLLRRRHYFVRKRADLFKHIENIFHQYAMRPPALKVLKNKIERQSIVNNFKEPDIIFSIQSDISLISSLDEIINPLESQILKHAKQHCVRDFNTLMSIPGCGQISSLNVLYEIDSIHRFPSHQNFSSYCRVVKGKFSSADKSSTARNNKIGNPYLKWAMSEIAVHSIEFSPEIKSYYNKLLNKFSKGKAKSILAHKFANAIFFMLKKNIVFDVNKIVK